MDLVSSRRCQKSQDSNEYHDIEEVVGLERLIWAPSNRLVLCPNPVSYTHLTLPTIYSV